MVKNESLNLLVFAVALAGVRMRKMEEVGGGGTGRGGQRCLCLEWWR